MAEPWFAALQPILSIHRTPGSAAEIFVAPIGDDSATSTASQPVAMPASHTTATILDGRAGTAQWRTWFAHLVIQN